MSDVVVTAAPPASDARHATLARELDALELVPYHNPAAAAEPALALAQEANDLGFEDLVPRARLVYADAIGRQGDVAGGGTIARQVNEWATRNGNSHLVARSERLLSSFYSRIGDMAAALEHAVHSVELLTPEVPKRLAADHLMGLALAYGRTKSFDAARDRFAVILGLADDLEDVDLRIATLNNLAFVEYWAGQPEASMRVAERMQRIAEHHGVVLEASYLDTVARAQMMLGNYEQAELTLAPTLTPEGAELITEADDLAEILLTVAECQRMIGAFGRAQASLQRSAELCDERDLEEVRVRVMQERAALLAARGDFEAAYQQHREFHAASEAIYSWEREVRARILAVVFETEEAVRSSKRFREMSLRDALTGLYNRRYVDDRVPAMLSRSQVDASLLSLAIIDLDYFKTINDQLSHDRGDEVLRALAPILQADLPDGGFVARLGGEEFVLVMPDVDATTALTICEALRCRVQNHPWAELVGTLTVTASIGVATAFAGTHSFNSLLGEADRRLYVAKRRGRNLAVGS